VQCIQFPMVLGLLFHLELVCCEEQVLGHVQLSAYKVNYLPAWLDSDYCVACCRVRQ
jgi:hypothetical protein